MKNHFEKMHFLASRGFRLIKWGVMEAPQRQLYDLEHRMMEDVSDEYGVTFIGVPEYEQPEQIYP